MAKPHQSPSLTTNIMACPRCLRDVDNHDRTCPHCGVDLALAAVLVENELIVSRHPQGLPVTPEVLVPRLGEHLIAKQLLDPAQLGRALDYQRKQAASNQPVLLGQALLELGYIDREVLDEAITQQILELQDALNKANRRLEQRVQERTAELQQALEKLAELNQLKSNFISNISHELRTPLTHVKGYVELMMDNGLGPLTEDQDQALKVMLRASERLENLINDLLRFSLASMGEFTLHMSDLQLDLILSKVIKETRGKANDKGVTLGMRCPQDLPLIRGDSDKITWVLLQLLDNAIKFTNTGGEVRMIVRPSRSGVNVTIADTGVGIPPERIQEIFEPFHQLDGSTTRRHEGTGLGLALVARIIEAHGSLIRVKSQVGVGSQFEFSLPLASPN